MNIRILACLLLTALFFPVSAKAQLEELDRMFLVLVEVEKPADIPLCYTSNFDKKRVRIDFAFEDTINYLADFVYEEEPLYGPDCFVPEMKLIFQHYTYVVSLYCTAAIKYKNSAPYTPSSTRMKNDLVFTESVYQYLGRLKIVHFSGKAPNQALLDKVVTSDPLEDADDTLEAVEDMFLEDAEIDDLDAELQSEAGANDGMFDAVEIEEADIDEPEEILEEEAEAPKKPVAKPRQGG